MNGYTLFIFGALLSLLYFYHLYLQLKLLKSKKRNIFFSFSFRFVLLSVILGWLFYSYEISALYSAAGFITGRFVAIRLIKLS
ncbi:ATP synthase subunit I [Nitrosophilus alvini]|uniref:N-ATPase subunit AtpR n=1 Tax=Nitrosophilus alvini TaxID=2714855 RepID=UPI00190E444D|nr:ATP synthase subunit I [Nitrosophilus alvini]